MNEGSVSHETEQITDLYKEFGFYDSPLFRPIPSDGDFQNFDSALQDGTSTQSINIGSIKQSLGINGSTKLLNSEKPLEESILGTTTFDSFGNDYDGEILNQIVRELGNRGRINTSPRNVEKKSNHEASSVCSSNIKRDSKVRFKLPDQSCLNGEQRGGHIEENYISMHLAVEMDSRDINTDQTLRSSQCESDANEGAFTQYSSEEKYSTETHCTCDNQYFVNNDCNNELNSTKIDSNDSGIAISNTETHLTITDTKETTERLEGDGATEKPVLPGTNVTLSQCNMTMEETSGVTVEADGTVCSPKVFSSLNTKEDPNSDMAAKSICGTDLTAADEVEALLLRSPELSITDSVSSVKTRAMSPIISCSGVCAKELQDPSSVRPFVQIKANSRLHNSSRSPCRGSHGSGTCVKPTKTGVFMAQPPVATIVNNEKSYTLEETKQALNKFVRGGRIPSDEMAVSINQYVDRIKVLTVTKGNYDKAARLDKVLTDMKKALSKKGSTTGLDEKILERSQKINNAKTDLKLCKKLWDAKIDTAKEDAHKQMKDLEMKQKEEIKNFNCKWDEPETLRFFSKPSSELRDMRALERKLVILKHYEKAKEVRKLADELEIKETEDQQERALREMFIHKQKLIEKHEEQKRKLRERLRNGIVLLEKQKNDEISSINKRIKKLDVQITDLKVHSAPKITTEISVLSTPRTNFRMNKFRKSNCIKPLNIRPMTALNYTAPAQMKRFKNRVVITKDMFE